MKIIQLPNRVLRSQAKPVRFPLDDKTTGFIEEMIKYIDDSQLSEFEERSGVGIAAPQIGISLRMFYVNVPLPNNENYREFLINPIIMGESETEAALDDGEGCLSVPENQKKYEGYVKRKFKIIIEAYSYFQKKKIRIEKTGYTAIVLQHELDHINGLLFIDKINSTNPWKKNEQLILI